MAFEFYSHLSRGIAVSAAYRDEGIGGPCFHRDDVIFCEVFYLCVVSGCSLSIALIKIHFLSDIINNITEPSILRKAKLGRTLPFDGCGVLSEF